MNEFSLTYEHIVTFQIRECDKAFASLNLLNVTIEHARTLGSSIPYIEILQQVEFDGWYQGERKIENLSEEIILYNVCYEARFHDKNNIINIKEPKEETKNSALLTGIVLVLSVISLFKKSKR